MTVMPLKLTRVAPAGTDTALAGPTGPNRPSSTTSTASSIGGVPVLVITRAPS